MPSSPILFSPLLKYCLRMSKNLRFGNFKANNFLIPSKVISLVSVL